MTWTILRPVSFMDNLAPGFIGKAFAGMWAQVGEKPLQLVSTQDIGRFSAGALLNPGECEGGAIRLAGDELNAKQAAKIFSETLGLMMP